MIHANAAYKRAHKIIIIELMAQQFEYWAIHDRETVFFMHQFIFPLERFEKKIFRLSFVALYGACSSSSSFLKIWLALCASCILIPWQWKQHFASYVCHLWTVCTHTAHAQPLHVTRAQMRAISQAPFRESHPCLSHQKSWIQFEYFPFLPSTKCTNLIPHHIHKVYRWYD